MAATKDDFMVLLKLDEGVSAWYRCEEVLVFGSACRDRQCRNVLRNIFP